MIDYQPASSERFAELLSRNSMRILEIGSDVEGATGRYLAALTGYEVVGTSIATGFSESALAGPASGNRGTTRSRKLTFSNAAACGDGGDPVPRERFPLGRSAPPAPGPVRRRHKLFVVEHVRATAEALGRAGGGCGDVSSSFLVVVQLRTVP